MDQIKRVINGEEFIFDKRRVIYWPRRRALIAADLHWGKTHYFRQHGRALPEEAFEKELNILSDVFKDYETKTFLVLGDLIHHEKSLTPELLRRISWFRHYHPCELLLLQGNHDRYTDFPESWGIIQEPELRLDGFLFVHEEIKKGKEAHFVFSGHLHPMVSLKSGFEKIRAPAFVLSSQSCYLPAFARLSGGVEIKLNAHSEALVVFDHGLEPFR